MQGISEKVWLAQGIFDIPTCLKCPQLKYKQNQCRLKELWPYILLAFHFKKKKPCKLSGTRAHPAPWLRPSFHLFQGDETPPWSPARLPRECCACFCICSLSRAVNKPCQERWPNTTLDFSLGSYGPRTKAWIPTHWSFGTFETWIQIWSLWLDFISRVSVGSSAHKHLCHGIFLLYSTMNQELLLWSYVRLDHKW